MRLPLTLMMFCVSFGATAQITMKPMQADESQVMQWNQFVDALYALHKKQIDGREIRETSQYDGYFQQPRFYREVKYYDAAKERLLSRIAWESDNPERIHEIEVFIYDEHGRVKRDFLARYLPVFRNAPIQTLINLHAYNGSTHSYRQFDASGNRIYETCKGELSDEKISIDLEEDQIFSAGNKIDSIFESLDYEICFGEIPKTAGKFLTPQ